MVLTIIQKSETKSNDIQLLEYPNPRPCLCTSQKPSSADISETESYIIDPLVSKQPETNSEHKNIKS